MSAASVIPAAPRAQALRRRPTAAAQALAGSVVVGFLLVSLALIFGRPNHTVELAANMLGAPQGADVVDIKPPVVALPAEPTHPIDVPADPYAAEPVVQLGRIVIPKIGLDHVLMHGVTLNNIDQGPSHWPGSAYPGHIGNSVIAGHRVTHTHPFLHIDQLVPGDQIIVTAQGLRSTYAVTDSFVVLPEQTSIVDATPTAVLTIFACHPPHSATHRYVVRAALVGTAPA